ncbi:BnaAnng34460D [Brassica napus]|uniref:BnaAnng34460D protein n=1 Tax=Brassica napus TaxID=3708 RepID=A0A078JSP2_BRANA|nr:BnaAnng34460D [Brassica napus]
MATEHITRKADEYSVELLPSDDDAPPPLSSSWRLSLETFRLPSSLSSTGRHDGRTRFSRYFRTPSELYMFFVFQFSFWFSLNVFRVDHRRLLHELLSERNHVHETQK